MLQSQLLTKTQKKAPKDEKSINAKLLTQAGFVDKLMAGTYSYLPLGLRVLKNIENIIREEMNGILGQEILLPALHPKKNWQQTGRWKYKEMFKLKGRGGKDYSLGWTHEEVITPLVKKFVHSYKDLPVFVYQIQDKFRDELRAKSGLLRGREFLMKDFYSFHSSEEDFEKYYKIIIKAYFRIFKRCGLSKQTFLTLASGGAFCKRSHEFQTITPYGEDEIYLCQKCKLGINKEIIKEEKYKCSECGGKKLEIKKTIEVGNIFGLKDKFSKAFNLTFKDRDGKEKIVLMGCYGLGLSRLMGVIVEVYNDKKGILWPEEISPFSVHLLALGGREKKIEEKIQKIGKKIYKDLQKKNIEVLYDDRRGISPGEKFADADLIGIPHRVVISEKTLKKGCVEIKKRNEKKIKLIKIKNFITYV